MKRLFLMLWLITMTCVLVAMTVTSKVQLQAYRAEITPVYVDYLVDIADAISRELNTSSESTEKVLQRWKSRESLGLETIELTQGTEQALRVQKIDIASGHERVSVMVPIGDGRALKLTYADEYTADYARHSLLARLLVFMLIAALLWWLSRYCYRYFEALSLRTRAIAEGRFDTDTVLTTSLPGFDELSQDIDNMAAQLADRQAAQATFVGAVAHELRTPFTRMRLALDMTQSAVNDKAGSHHAEQILQLLVDVDAGLEDATLLTNEMMQLARLSLSNESLLLHEIDIGQIIFQVVSDLSDPRIKCTDTKMSRVMSTETLCRQVVRNLLQNALRYAKNEVSLSAKEDCGLLTLHIDDDGPGIAEADKSRIFDPFQRGRQGDGRGNGYGLGLAFAARAMHSCGGFIETRTSPQGGARFSVGWPIAHPNDF